MPAGATSLSADFLFMRDAISMNICFPTFDFFVAGISDPLSICQFEGGNLAIKS